MKCIKCGSNNVRVEANVVNIGGTLKEVSILRRVGRVLLILCTCGMWALVPKTKARYVGKQQTIKTCTCRRCGHIWQE